MGKIKVDNNGLALGIFDSIDDRLNQMQQKVIDKENKRQEKELLKQQKIAEKEQRKLKSLFSLKEKIDTYELLDEKELSAGLKQIRKSASDFIRISSDEKKSSGRYSLKNGRFDMKIMLIDGTNREYSFGIEKFVQDVYPQLSSIADILKGNVQNVQYRIVDENGKVKQPNQKITAYLKKLYNF
jgi:hypothetical protein